MYFWLLQGFWKLSVYCTFYTLYVCLLLKSQIYLHQIFPLPQIIHIFLIINLFIYFQLFVTENFYFSQLFFEEIFFVCSYKGIWSLINGNQISSGLWPKVLWRISNTKENLEHGPVNTHNLDLLLTSCTC